VQSRALSAPSFRRLSQTGSGEIDDRPTPLEFQNANNQGLMFYGLIVPREPSPA
jgi:hypothetical protein